VLRDTNSSFETQIIKKRQRRLTASMDRWIVLSLTAKGLATGEVAARFADVYPSSELLDPGRRQDGRQGQGRAQLVGQHPRF
jgi:transposase-like protein